MKSFACVTFFLVSIAVAQTNTTEEEFCGYTAINGLTSGRNNQKCGELIDEAFLPYNAMYNGTLTLQLKGNAPTCPENRYTMDNYVVGIGPMSVTGNSTFTRTTYDKNPFYLWMKYQENKNISAGFLSSSDYFLTESQWWTLTSTKSGNGFDIAGNYTGKLAAYSNVYNYPSDECWSVNIYNHIVKAEVLSATDYRSWSVKGRLEVEKVSIEIDQFVLEKGVEYHTVFTYEGTANPGAKGARLVVSEGTPTTDLALRGSLEAKNETANGTGSNGASGLRGSGSGGLIVAGSVGVVISVLFAYL